ncbi:MAG: hypothetical protein HFI67_03720 [Lachnospiraceae bacterium]|jgi:hypothetical protein|nr:hypothetical protein [Lachnospiraceae bacterium]
MKITKISFYELMEDMEEDFWEAVSSTAISKTTQAGYRRLPGRKFCIWRKVRTALFPSHGRLVQIYRLAGLFLVFAVISSVTVYSLSGRITKNTQIDDSNRHLIGTETVSDTYYIYENGKYYDKYGTAVDMEALCQSQDFDPSQSRIVKNMDDLKPLSAPVTEFPVDQAEENIWYSQEIMLVNASPAVFTKSDGSGWALKPGESLSYTFDKYPSETSSNQRLHIGFVKNGVMYQGETFPSAAGTYGYTAEEEGEYYLYLISYSSDCLSLKEGVLVQIQSH